MARRGWRWLVATGLVLGLLPLASLGVAADDAVVTECTEAAFDDALETAHTNGSGSITFACSGVISFAGQKEISASVTILGEGNVTLQGTGDSRLFLVHAGATLELDGLRLENGDAGEEVGGAILNNGALTVSASTFSGNRASVSGGAIYTTGTLEVSDSEFSGNQAHNAGIPRGGAIYNDSGGMVTVEASTFSGNLASYGGAIYNASNGTVVVAASTFTGHFTSVGGAIYTTARLEVTASTFSGNRAAGIGGAIFISSSGGTASVSASTFSDNWALDHGGAIFTANQLTVTASTFNGNRAELGGAIYSSDFDPVVLQSTILVRYTPDGAANCGTSSESGGYTSAGYNLSDDASCNLTAAGDIPDSQDIQLGPLQDNGGPTETMLPLFGSAAIGAIPPDVCAGLSTPVDQRGIARPSGARCEIGAVELAQAVICANRYTGQVRGPLADQTCASTSTPLVLPSEEPETLCIHPSTGALTWAPRGNCGALLKHVVPDSGPLSYCEHTLTGALRYSRTGACSPVERGGVLPADL